MKITVNHIKEMKTKGEKIAMLTAYDYATAKIADEAGIPILLVGDSLGMVMLGYDSTIPVTTEDMLHHTKAVTRATRNSMVVSDMPFMSYHLSEEQALANAARFIQEGNAQAVKLEGGVNVASKVKRIVDCGIPVMGHIGLTPQSVNQFGGYRAQGKTVEAARRLIKDAQALEKAGAFAIVLETMPSELAGIITHEVAIPVIGIGAGPECDGQVQVIGDILGLSNDFVPRHAKQYVKLADIMAQAIRSYHTEVKDGTFPGEKQSLFMDKAVLAELTSAMEK
jgi:3-methyl-2-oxobutanoate hydroxymethyltransferase